MQDENKTLVSEETPIHSTDGGNQGGEIPTPKNGEGEEKTFTQEEVNRLISERIKREQEKFEKTLVERLEAERQEAERLAKLSAEEKEKELRKKEQEKLVARERELKLKENRLDGLIKLDQLGVPKDFIDFVLSEDTDKMDKNIDTLKKSWDEAINLEVERRLAGKTPKAPTSIDSKTNAVERKNYF